MNWRTLAVLSVVGAVLACDIPFLKRDQAADTTAAAPTTAATQPADSGAAAAADTLARPATSPAQAPRQAAPRQVAAQPMMDEPWSPTDTGTVAPGMSRDQVVALWGAPVAERAAGTRSYIYYRNGCEVSCGTFDVVFLENGQVVDAIVRWGGHGYAGTSSSPPDAQPWPTLARSQQGGTD